VATPVTSVEWTITFKLDSLVTHTTYSISLDEATPKAVVQGLISELRALGYVEVAALLRVVLP
jgi:hypothetical protein